MMKIVNRYIILLVFFSGCDKNSVLSEDLQRVYISKDYSAAIIYGYDSIKFFTPYGKQNYLLKEHQRDDDGIVDFLDGENLRYRIKTDSASITLLSYSTVLTLNNNWEKKIPWDSIIIKVISNDELQKTVFSVNIDAKNKIIINEPSKKLDKCNSTLFIKESSENGINLIKELDRINYNTFDLLDTNDSHGFTFLHVVKYYEGEKVINIKGSEIPPVYYNLNNFFEKIDDYTECI